MCNDYDEFPDSDWAWSLCDAWREHYDHEQAARYDRFDGYDDPYLCSDCPDPDDLTDFEDFEDYYDFNPPDQVGDGFNDCPF